MSAVTSWREKEDRSEVSELLDGVSSISFSDHMIFWSEAFEYEFFEVFGGAGWTSVMALIPELDPRDFDLAKLLPDLRRLLDFLAEFLFSASK